MASMTGAPTWSIRKNLLLLAGMSTEEAYHWIKENYFSFVAWTVVISMSITALGAIFNATGLYSANLILAALTLISGVALAAWPTVLVGVILIGKNVTGAKTRTEAMSIYAKAIAHILLFASLVFMVLASVRIENFWALLFLFVALAAAGMLSIAGSVPPKIYYTVTTVMVVGFVVLSAFNMLAYQHPQDAVAASAERGMLEEADARDRAELQPLDAILNDGNPRTDLNASQRIRYARLQQAIAERSGVRGVFNQVAGSGTVDVKLTDARPQIVGGFPPGYIYVKATNVEVIIGGSHVPLERWVALNGKNPADGPILVPADGKVTFELRFTDTAIRNTRFANEQTMELRWSKLPFLN